MDSRNVFQLTSLNPPPFQNRSYFKGDEKEAEFLSLRLLTKRGRVRVSQAPIDYSRLPGKLSLLAVGNHKGYLAAAVRKDDENYILVSTLLELRTKLESGQPDPAPYIPFASQRPLLKVPGNPIIVKFAWNDERLVVGFLEGPISVYNTVDLFISTNSQQTNPVHTLLGDASSIPRDILPNPGENPSLMAILRGVHGQEPGHQVDIINLQDFKQVVGWRKASDPNISPVSISWSPKGKQIAIGLQSGDILLYSPQMPDNPKTYYLKPSNVPPEGSSALATTWLANPTFHTVFSSPEASSSAFDPSMSSSLNKTHVVSTYDSKSQSALDIELLDPSPPFGAQIGTGPMSIVLRNWEPTKFLVICGDGPSPDIGIIGSMPISGGEESWVNISLEETSTPSLPLGEDTQDMALLGLEIDLTSFNSVRMSEQPDDGTPDLPPSPILYAYMSDGTIVAWHILNTKGIPYPGMVANAPSAGDPRPSLSSNTQANTSASDMVEINASPPSAFIPGNGFGTTATSASTVSPAPVVGRTPSAPIAPAQGFGAFNSFNNTSSKFGSTGFGFGGGPTSSAFGSSLSAFGSAEREQNPASAPAFGASGFGQSTSAPTFSATGFGSKSAAPAFGISGFGSKPAAPAFGQSGFAAASSAPLQSAFGSSSTGGFAAFANQGTSAFNVPASSSSVSDSKSSGGFAAFANQGTSTFGTPMSSPSASKAEQSSIFGQSAFGGFTSATSSPQSTFGSGIFGQSRTTPKSAFGSGGFGQAASTTPLISAFGGGSEASTTSVFGKQPGAQTSGFGAFGQKITTPAFGQPTFGTSMTSTSSPSMEPLGDALKPEPSFVPPTLDSPRGSPLSQAGSLPGSPELRPSSQPPKPASSYLRPASGFGADIKPSGFASHGSSSNASPTIKSAEGLGKFSSAAPTKPTVFGFDNQPKPTSSAFGTSGFAAAASTAVPTFGSPSALGIAAKSVFGTSSLGTLAKPTASEPSKPITGGFGAFSSGSGGFASFASTTKTSSFAEMLSTAKEDKPKLDNNPLVFGNTPSAKPTQRKASQLPTETNLPSSTLDRSTPVVSKSVDVTEVDSVKEPDIKKGQLKDTTGKASPSGSPSLSKESSFSLLSPSEAASQVERTPSQVASGDEADEVEDSASEPFSVTDDGIAGSDSEGRGNRSKSVSPNSLSEDETEGVKISLPETPTRQTPTPTNRPSSLPALDISSPNPTVVPSIATLEKTTILSGSPDPASTSGIGIGRPSSRAFRSSPLASSPIISPANKDDDTIVEQPKPVPERVSLKPAEPKDRLGQIPTPPQAASTALMTEAVSSSAPRRPKTPPLLNASSSPSGMPVRSPFGQSQTQGPSVYTKASSPLSQFTTTAIPQTVVLPASPVKEELHQDPLKAEFHRANMEVMNELAQLHQKALGMRLLYQSSRQQRDVGKVVQEEQNTASESHSAGGQWAILIDLLREAVHPLIEQGEADKHLLQDLQNLVLMTETKHEELQRWLRAREDPEFAKTLKPRALGPEHSENQIRLRKALQAAQDRVQKCEDEMEALKKRLERYKTGKWTVQAPSLDTIDRTCRNIRIALEERRKLLEQLEQRIDTLSPQSSQRLQSSPSRTIPITKPVAPPFANMAAAALNSERSSLKLKNILLTSRKEPLLTTKVIKVEPSKIPSLGISTSPQTLHSEGLSPTTNFSTSSGHVAPHRRNAWSGPKRGAVEMRSSPNTKHIAFDWGPLPGVVPMNTLSPDVRSPKGSS